MCETKSSGLGLKKGRRDLFFERVEKDKFSLFSSSEEQESKKSGGGGLLSFFFFLG